MKNICIAGYGLVQDWLPLIVQVGKEGEKAVSSLQWGDVTKYIYKYCTLIEMCGTCA